MGPELQIVVLDMSLEDQMERVRGRHGGEEAAVDMFKVRLIRLIQLYDGFRIQAVYHISESAQQDEPNTIDLKVTPDMKPQDVVMKVLQMIS